MKAVFTTSLIGLLVVAANLIGVIAVAAAASLLVGAGNVKSNSHPTHDVPAAHSCAQTCPLHTTNS